ncbi:MAG: glutamate formimidoyltransferase [bacterium]|nr:glutamate formimidoyltransferase [bacterium]
MSLSRNAQLVECVPNFSEGRDAGVISRITEVIETVEGAKLLDIDPGKATNRTVVTFVGHPEAVTEAAFRAIARAAELIDMSQHRGEHPRMGATDVCPLVPISGLTMEETVEWAQRLAERVGRELDFPVYLYEHAATSPERRNLATVREGEYEGLAEKLRRPEWAPDFGPAEFRPGPGATAVGARDFLIAYNVNLNTTSTRRATAVAWDVREKGRVMREGGKPGGKILRDERGKKRWQAGTLPGVKAIGWFIEEYGLAQVSLNITDMRATPVHKVFEEVAGKARARGLRATGSELVGLIPLQAMLDAGRHFLAKQQRSLGVPEDELIKIAVKSMGLDDLAPFDPAQKIIEYQLRDPADDPLVHMDLRAFAAETASESPAPGGGSVAAYAGALGAALATMVANLSSHKRGWDDRWEDFSGWAEKGQALEAELLRLVDEDTHAFNRIGAAFRLPKKTAEEKQARAAAVAEATRGAIDAPFQVMQRSLEAMEVATAMARDGMSSSVSDAGVGALCARAALRGAHLNVLINAAGFDDQEYLAEKLRAAKEMAAEAERLEAEILGIVEERMG